MVWDRMVTGSTTLSLTINKDITTGQPIETVSVTLRPKFTDGVRGTLSGNTHHRCVLIEVFVMAQTEVQKFHMKQLRQEEENAVLVNLGLRMTIAHLCPSHPHGRTTELQSYSLSLFDFCPANGRLFLWTWSWKTNSRISYIFPGLA